MTEESTELAVRNAELEIAGHMGDRKQIAAIKQRIVAMAQVPPDVPDYVVWQAAQLATMLELNPFTGDLYIMETGSEKAEGSDKWTKKYAVHVGVKGLRKLARRKANFQTAFRVLDAEEVKSSRPREYTSEDVGVECTLWRLDVAMECRVAGIPYMPTKAVGYWRKQAQQRNVKGGGKEWKPDNIPNTWTPQMVAEKRAEVNAIKKAFDIEYDVDDPARAGDDERLAILHRQLESIERDEAPVQRPDLRIEDDGDILFDNPVTVYAAPAPPEVLQTIDTAPVRHEEVDFGFFEPSAEAIGQLESTPAPESTPARESTLCPHCHAPAGKPHAKNCPTLKAESTPEEEDEPEPAPPSTMTADGVELADYIYLFHNPDVKFAPATVKVIKEFRELKHGETMNPKQHGYIVSLIDQAYGSEEFKPHRYILSALAGRLVDHDHPLSLAQKVILTWFKHPELNTEQMAGMNAFAAQVIELYRDQEDV